MFRLTSSCVVTLALAGCALSDAEPEDAHNSDLAGEWGEVQEQQQSAWESAYAAGTEADHQPLIESHGYAAPLVDEDVGLAIHVFDLGQADATLVIGPAPERRTLLVDLGAAHGGAAPKHGTPPGAHVLRRIEELTGRRHVDYFVLSHYHSDHAGLAKGADEGWGSGIIGLLSRTGSGLTVGEFLHIGDLGADYMEPERGRSVYTGIKRRMPFWRSRGRVGRDVRPEFGVGQIDLGSGVSVDILAFGALVPSGRSALDRAAEAGADYEKYTANENDLSIALEVSLGEFEFFTAGDLNGTDDPNQYPLFRPRKFGEIYANVERLLVEHWEAEGRESDVEVYRANHHGSQYSNTQRLLDALDPEWVLFSTGGQYSHPTTPVIDRAAGTAGMLTTTFAANYPRYREQGGRTVGEIVIEVSSSGDSYTIAGDTFASFSDEAEARGDDEVGG